MPLSIASPPVKGIIVKVATKRTAESNRQSYRIAARRRINEQVCVVVVLFNVLRVFVVVSIVGVHIQFTGYTVANTRCILFFKAMQQQINMCFQISFEIQSFKFIKHSISHTLKRFSLWMS